MNRILVPTDFSNTAKKALHYAMDIAHRTNGKVYLYHSHTVIESPFIETVEVREKHNQGEEKKLMDQLHQLRDAGKVQYPGVEVIVALGRSPFVASFLSFCANYEIDLVVMGTQGATGLRKVVIGTFAARVIEQTKVPLLLVPEHFEWKVPQHFVIATDCKAADTHTARLADALAKLYSAEIAVVTIHETSNNGKAADNAVFSECVLEMQAAAGGRAMESKMLEGRHLTSALEQLHDTTEYDVLVMTRRKKTFIKKLFGESITKHMGYLTHYPLLVVPAE